MRVKLEIDEPLPLRNEGIILHIKDGASKVGRLRIGKALVEWLPTGKWKGNGHKFRLRDFCEYLNKAAGGKMRLKPKKK